MAVDPFTLVYGALWDMLEDSRELAALVKPANRIRFDGRDRAPDKPELTTADAPLVRIVPTSGAASGLGYTSTSSKVLLTFDIQVLALDARLQEQLYPVSWALLCAMSNWRTRLQALSWNGKSGFVIDAHPAACETQGTTGELGKQQNGWLDVWSYEVYCNFSTADMKAAGA